MAIDTRERRQSVVGISHYWSGPSVTPFAAQDAEWRQEAGWGYPGILAESPFTPIAGAMNESLRAFLNDQYGITNTDLVPLLDRFLDTDTIADKTVSFRELRVATDVENR